MLQSNSFKVNSSKVLVQENQPNRFHFCLHPILNVAAVTFSETVAEYDLSSGCKLGSTESADPLLAIQYTSDSATLIGLTQVNSRLNTYSASPCPQFGRLKPYRPGNIVQSAVLAWEPQFWKRKVLLQSTGKLVGGEALLAVGQVGFRPIQK
jgi:hypothetical protein